MLYDDSWAIMAHPPGRRDLGDPELWERSLARSHRRRAAAERRSGVPVGAASAALLFAAIAGPAGGVALAHSAVGLTGARIPTLSIGARGPAVLAAQRALGVVADGIFGPRTQAAALAFQRAHGLAADGVIGPLTTGALNAGAGTSIVAALQRAVGVVADGDYGPLTRAAVQRFQLAHGLVADGVAGPRTLAALGLPASRTLGVGGTGRAPVVSGRATVVALQRAVGVGADGDYGPLTRAAVGRFQLAHGLVADGVAGPRTLAALGLPISPTLRLGGMSAAPAFARAGTVVAAAEAKLGFPYRLGGNGPIHYDCSGLTVYAMAQAGVALPRTSYQQFGVGRAVNRSAIQAGDLVFFDTDGTGASHVGIATSNTTFISATLHGVRVYGTFDSYWGPRYLGARRVS